jgi:hypothetical protein
MGFTPLFYWVCRGLGVDLTLVPLFCAVALISAWPFSRWSGLHASFAYPLACIFMAPLWFYYTTSDVTQVVLGVGLVVLAANALRRGAMRGILMAMAVLLIGVWMKDWVIQRDPFTTIILTQDISIWWQLALTALHIPFLIFLVMTLWISRLRGRHWWLNMPNRDLLAMLSGFVCVVLWVHGIRESLLASLLAVAALVSIAPSITNELRLAKVSGFRHPITSTLAIILMLFLVTLSHAINLLPENAPPSTQRMKPAGAMGTVYLQVLREGAACVFALLSIVTWQLSCRHGQDIVVMATSTIRRQLPQNPKAKVIALLGKLKLGVMKVVTLLVDILLWKVGLPLSNLFLKIAKLLQKPFKRKVKVVN